MFEVGGLLTLHTWAHQCYAVLLDHCSRLTGEELRRPFEGFGWPSLHSQLAHIAEAEAFWVTRARGEQFERWPRRGEWWDYDGLDDYAELRARYADTISGTRSFLEGLTAPELLKPRVIELSAGGSIEISPARMLMHIVTHGFHHKGQAAAICRLLGYPTPETDLDSVTSEP